MRIKRITAGILALCVVLGAAALVYASENAASAPHWAQAALNRWSVLDRSGHWLSAPDGPLTLGDATSLIAGVLRLETEDDSPAAAATACVKAGLLESRMAGVVDLEDVISRQGFLTLLARALRLPPENHTETAFADLDAISPEVRGEVYAMLNRGYLNGVAPGQLAPGGVISRAEGLTVLDRAVRQWITTDSAFVEADGGMIVVAAHDVTLTGTAGAVLAAEGARDASLALEDLKTERITLSVPVALLAAGQTESETLHVLDTAAGSRVYVGESAALGDIRMEGEAEFFTDSRAEPSLEPEPEPEQENPVELSEPEPEAVPEADDPAEAEELFPEETPAEPEPKPEPPAVPGAVLKAPLRDYADLGRTVYDSYAVTATPAADWIHSYDFQVKLEMTGLKPHKSSGAGYGWWTGFSVVAPENATGVVASYSSNGETYGSPVRTDLIDGRYTHYFDAVRWLNYYVRLQWTGPELTEAEQIPVIYKLDFSGVEADVSSLTAADSVMGQFGVAALWDWTEGDAHLDRLFDTYGLSAESKRDSNGGYIELTVHAEGLRSHRSGAGKGYWAGFSAAAPEGAAAYRFTAYRSLEAAKQNFSKMPLVLRDSFYQNVNGFGADGVLQKSDAAQVNQRDYWVVLQWFADEAGVTSLTAPEIYHVVLDAALAAS